MLAARGMGGQHLLAGKIEERAKCANLNAPQRERTVNHSDSKVLVFGTRGSAEAFAIRDFLHRCDVPFQWIEVSPDQPDALRAYAGVLTTGQLDRDPYYLETSIPGVFAAGDVRRGSVERCASAVGEGAMAVTFVHRYVMNG